MKNFFKNIKKKKKQQSCLGFTLVEILVVMAIIVMMSTLAVSGYMSYRRTALLDLGADNLISQIGAMKAKATYGSTSDAKFKEISEKLKSDYVAAPGGTVAEKDLAKCHGVAFEKSVTGETFDVKNFKVDFNNKKVWKNTAWEYQGCGDYDATTKATALELDSQLKISGISCKNTDGSGCTIGEKFVLRYLPPNGKLEVVDVGSSGKPVILTDLESIKFKVSYGVSDDENYQREIELDLSNSKFSVDKIEKNDK